MDEYLLHGSIGSDDYCILAIFPGTAPATCIKVSLPGLVSDAQVPIAQSSPMDFIQFLCDEMYSLTGVQNDVKLYTLLFAIAAVPVQVERDDTDKNQMFVAIRRSLTKVLAPS